MKILRGSYKLFDKPYRKEIRIESSLMEKLMVYAADSKKSVNRIINEIIELGVIQLERERELNRLVYKSVIIGDPIIPENKELSKELKP